MEIITLRFKATYKELVAFLKQQNVKRICLDDILAHTQVLQVQGLSVRAK
jgi:hypothetical protein